jgi:dihydroflavonol-4-reductase
MRVPHAVALGFAVFDQFFTGTILRKEPRATIDAVRMGRKKMFASSAKAEKALGYKVLPIEDALRRAINWFNTHGYVEGSGTVAPVRA